jgi:hypothetical protein
VVEPAAVPIDDGRIREIRTDGSIPERGDATEIDLRGAGLWGGHFLTSGHALECDGPYGFVKAIRLGAASRAWCVPAFRCALLCRDDGDAKNNLGA